MKARSQLDVKVTRSPWLDYVSRSKDIAAADGPFITGNQAIRFLLDRLRPSQLNFGYAQASALQ